MKRKLCLILCLLIFSGCTVNYNLEINDNVINESISITDNISNFDETIADSNIENAYSEFKNHKITKYNTSKKKEGNSVTYNLSQKYTLSDSLYLRAFTECFDAYKFIYADDTKTSYIIQTSEGFRCMDYEYQKVDKYKINIKTNHKVINHNADEVNGNVYTWNIDNSNASNKAINFVFENTEENSSKKNTDKKNTIKMVFVIIGICGVLGLIVLLYVLGISTKRNKI